MRFVKNSLVFGCVGLALSLIIFGLSSVAPNVFGWLSAPFWICQPLQTSVLTTWIGLFSSSAAPSAMALWRF